MSGNLKQYIEIVLRYWPDSIFEDPIEGCVYYNLKEFSDEIYEIFIYQNSREFERWEESKGGPNTRLYLILKNKELIIVLDDSKPSEILLILEDLRKVSLIKEITSKELIAARCVKHAFIKKQGDTAYLKMSPTAMRFLKLDSTKVYGISFNSGNVAIVEPATLVREMPLSVVFTKYLLGDKLNEVVQYLISLEKK